MPIAQNVNKVASSAGPKTCVSRSASTDVKPGNDWPWDSASAIPRLDALKQELLLGGKSGAQFAGSGAGADALRHPID
jgi:hypothetical protein